MSKEDYKVDNEDYMFRMKKASHEGFWTVTHINDKGHALLFLEVRDKSQAVAYRKCRARTAAYYESKNQ